MPDHRVDRFNGQNVQKPVVGIVQYNYIKWTASVHERPAVTIATILEYFQ